MKDKKRLLKRVDIIREEFQDSRPDVALLIDELYEYQKKYSEMRDSALACRDVAVAQKELLECELSNLLKEVRNLLIKREDERVDQAFKANQLTMNQLDRISNIKDVASSFLKTLNDMTLPSREKNLAFTKLEECVMWAIKSIESGTSENTRFEVKSVR